MIDFFKDKEGILLSKEIKEKYTQELKKLGLINKYYERDFNFATIKKYCEEYEICDFKTANANKKDCKNNPELEYRKKYLRIVLKNRINSTPRQ